jgi:hypothetical protein
MIIYFDDSGTHSQSPVAVAACYVAPTDQWAYFERDWKRITDDEHITVLHLADFDRHKNRRALERLIGITRIRTRMGFAAAVPKDEYDAIVLPDPKLKRIMGQFHYTFATQLCLGFVKHWKEQYASQEKVTYVFDQMSQGKGEIIRIFKEFEKNPSNFLGVIPAGYTFENKSAVTPLQAADLLAWHVHRHMIDCIIPDAPEKKLPSTKLLEEGILKTQYFKPGQLQKWCDDIKQQAFYKNLQI